VVCRFCTSGEKNRVWRQPLKERRNGKRGGAKEEKSNNKKFWVCLDWGVYLSESEQMDLRGCKEDFVIVLIKG